MTYYELCEELCPGSRFLPDIQSITYDDIPVVGRPYIARDDKGKATGQWHDNVVYFDTKEVSTEQSKVLG